MKINPTRTITPYSEISLNKHWIDKSCDFFKDINSSINKSSPVQNVKRWPLGFSGTLLAIKIPLWFGLKPLTEKLITFYSSLHPSTINVYNSFSEYLKHTNGHF